MKINLPITGQEILFPANKTLGVSLGDQGFVGMEQYFLSGDWQINFHGSSLNPDAVDSGRTYTLIFFMRRHGSGFIWPRPA